jgi:hypothetical protein
LQGVYNGLKVGLQKLYKEDEYINVDMKMKGRKMMNMWAWFDVALV